MHHAVRLALVLACTSGSMFAPMAARAQEPLSPPTPNPTPNPTPASDTSDAPEVDRPLTPEETAAGLARIRIQLGAIETGQRGALGEEARIVVPSGWFLVPRAGTAQWLELTQNLPDPSLVGVLVREDLDSSIYFSFDPIGYVDDEDRDLDADALLQSMRDGEEASNRERKRLGYDALNIVGWARPPVYNEVTRSLEWGTTIRTNQLPGSEIINFNTRRLGRFGVMSVMLVTAPSELERDIVAMNANMNGFAFVEGRDYASFQQGDRSAEIGLGALVVGGGAALAAKAGFFKKFWKLLVLGGAAIGGVLIKLFRRKREEPAADAEPTPGDG